MVTSNKTADFKHSCIPIINEMSINSATTNLGGFYLSFNPNSAAYGEITTAIVLENRGKLFFVLNGDHKKELLEEMSEKGFQGVFDYFIVNLANANKYSEHGILLPDYNGKLNPGKEILDFLGEENIDKLVKLLIFPEPTVA